MLLIRLSVFFLWWKSTNIAVWNDLPLPDSSRMPGCICRDFNAILSFDEDSGGFNSWTTSMQEFYDFVCSVGYTDLWGTGDFLTWWKSSPLILFIESWAGFEWTKRGMILSLFCKWNSWLETCLIHCPALVDLGLSWKRLKKPFQFFRHLTNSHPEFFEVVGVSVEYGTPG